MCFNLLHTFPYFNVFVLTFKNTFSNFHCIMFQVKDIPWKSILIHSKPVLVLCLIFFKMGCSISTIIISGTLFSFYVGEKYNVSKCNSKCLNKINMQFLNSEITDKKHRKIHIIKMYRMLYIFFFYGNLWIFQEHKQKHFFLQYFIS